MGLDCYEGWRFIRCLEEVVRFEASSEVFDDKLGVLPTGLEHCQSSKPESYILLGAYYDNSFTPSTSPLTTDKADPIPLSPDTWTDRDSRIQLHADAEVKFECRGRKLQGTGDVAFRECMKEVVGRDGVFHDIEVGLTFEEMLALSTGVLGTDLLTIDTLN